MGNRVLTIDYMCSHVRKIIVAPLTTIIKQEEDLGPAGTPGDTTPIEAVGTLGVWIPDGAVCTDPFSIFKGLRYTGKCT